MTKMARDMVIKSQRKLYPEKERAEPATLDLSSINVLCITLSTYTVWEEATSGQQYASNMTKTPSRKSRGGVPEKNEYV